MNYLLKNASSLDPMPYATSGLSTAPHPAASKDFDCVYSSVKMAVAKGLVECQRHATGLEVFNYKPGLVSEDATVQMCRGLVLSPASRTIVAMPFVQFSGITEDLSSWDNLLWGPHAPHAMVQATMKMDGSLGIGFFWEGRILISTRRRLNSEQAQWATEWAQAHIESSAFVPGWTYLF